MSYPVMPLGFLGSQGDNDIYRIERSLRFNSGDSAYLSRTPASAGNRKTWTLSFWAKRSEFSSDVYVFGTAQAPSGTLGTYIGFASNTFLFGDYGASSWDWYLQTTALFRDASSWYHFVVQLDTTQSTSTERVKIYINGERITSFAGGSSYPTQNFDGRFNQAIATAIGRLGAFNGNYFNGYLTEINFIDGQALTPSSFGETDAITGRWKAKAYSGTYGTNGFYLKFADNSGTTATTLGKDSSGNGNNWTPNNFSVTAGAGNDSLVDSPTNYGTDTGVGGEVMGNYCTLNPINTISANTFSNGNLDVTIANGTTNLASGTIAISSGKWYWEVIPTSGAFSMIGISDASVSASNASWKTANGWAYYSDGSKYNNNSSSAYGASYATNDVIGVALNMDSGEVTFYKNNSSQGIAFNSGISGKTITPMLGNGATSASQGYTANFGQRPFAYTAPSGFKALCTTNLPQPTIQKPSSYMDVVTYTGNGSARSITGLGFSPDLVWIKTRANARSHRLADTVRGAGKELFSNETSAEATNDAGGYVSAFNSDGFTIGTGAGVNNSGETYVAWAWDEAPIAGMDIVSFAAPSSGNTTISHSLGVAPRMIIAKSRNSSTSWTVYHASATTKDQYLFLNTTNAVQTLTDVWGSAAPTSSVFGFNSNNQGASASVIAYLFAEVEGFSKFGSYTGNGSADGPFVFTGHRPRWIMTKRTDTTSNWCIHDAMRNGYNTGAGGQTALYSNSSVAEVDFNPALDILSSGFKLRTSQSDLNASGGTYIFCAFAESAFKYSRAR